MQKGCKNFKINTKDRAKEHEGKILIHKSVTLYKCYVMFKYISQEILGLMQGPKKLRHLHTYIRHLLKVFLYKISSY